MGKLGLDKTWKIIENHRKCEITPLGCDIGEQFLRI